jgi:hypothetical protein
MNLRFGFEKLNSMLVVWWFGQFGHHVINLTMMIIVPLVKRLGENYETILFFCEKVLILKNCSECTKKRLKGVFLIYI